MAELSRAAERLIDSVFHSGRRSKVRLHTRLMEYRRNVVLFRELQEADMIEIYLQTGSDIVEIRGTEKSWENWRRRQEARIGAVDPLD